MRCNGLKSPQIKKKFALVLEQSDLQDEFRQMERLEELTGVAIPENLRGLETKTELHTGVIEKEKMLTFVMEL